MAWLALAIACGDDTSGDTETDSATGFDPPSTSAGPVTFTTTADTTDADGTTTDEADASTGTPDSSDEGPADTTAADTAANTSTGNIFGEDCIVHVDATEGDDRMSGVSWREAKQSLVASLAVAANNECDIWVAAGTYYTSLDDDPADALTLFDQARLYGGFAGGETELDERDWEANPVVLSADIGREGDDSDNGFHVVRGADGALLDGVTVQGGRATDPGALIGGGGLLVESGSMTVLHCIFTDNESGDAPPRAGGAAGLDGGPGGAIGFVGDGLTIDDCTFDDNRTGAGSDGLTIGGDGGAGAAIAFDGTTLTITNSTFSNNAAGPGAEGSFGGAGTGGAVAFDGDVLTVEACSFSANSAGDGGAGMGGKGLGASGGPGGAIEARGGDIHITGSQFTNNSAGAGGDGTAGGGSGGFGGAIAVSSYESLTIDHCDFDGNAAGELGEGAGADGLAGFGGGLFVLGDAGDVLVAHSTFVGNTAGSSAENLGGAGGAIALRPSPRGRPGGATSVVHCTFAGNEASGGGAMFIGNKGVAALDVTGCAFGDNAAVAGGAIFYESASPEGDVDATLTNSILWGDAATVGGEIESVSVFARDPVVDLAVSYAVFEGDCLDGPALACGDAILDVDPLFADAPAGDLEALAPEIVDAGEEASIPPDVLDLDDDADTAEAWPIDLADAARVMGRTVDLGPFEQG